MSAHTRSLSLFIILATVLVLLAFPMPASAETFSVNTDDDLDDGQCDSNHCSLREAINAANSNTGPDLIEFSSLDASSQQISIHLMSPLPPLLDNGTTIDGSTVGGYAGEPEILISKGIPIIEVGVDIQGSNCTIRGLVIFSFGLPTSEQFPPVPSYVGGNIVITGTNNLIENNHLGLPAGPSTVGLRLEGYGNIANGNHIWGNGVGILIRNHSQVIEGNTILYNAYGIYDEDVSGGGHIIGGSGSGQGNIISGNHFAGVTIKSDNNTIEGNYIGTDASGTSADPNQYGISIQYATNNLIQGNLISGNELAGVVALNHSGYANNRLYGNKIGSDISGSFAVPNETGVQVFENGLKIGGLGAGEGNLIYGNTHAGIWVSSPRRGTYVHGNVITHNGGASAGPGVSFSFVTDPGTYISRNSFYDNHGLGIDDVSLFPMAPPVISDVTSSTVTGTSCHYCTVEVYLVEDTPDPSGAGEGKTWLGDIYVTALDGSFSETVPGIGFCQQITTIAIDNEIRTSEFSQNILANCYIFGPIFLIPIWTFIITVFGVIGIWVRRRNPARPPVLVPGGFAVGILVAAGLTFFANGLPGVMIGSPPEDTVPYMGQPPACDEFLDPDGFAPGNGAVLESFEDALLEWSPIGELPEGSIRWLVEVEDFVSQAASRVTPESSIPLSSFGLTPIADHSYGWTVQGQVSVDGGNTWLPFCNGLPGMTFMLSPEAVEEAEELPEDEPAPSEEPEDCEAELVALMNLTCRSGPDAIYEELGYLLEGETAVPEGISLDGFWYWILNPDWQGHCFVWSEGVEATCLGDLETINVPEPSPVPLQCLPTLEEEACIEAGGTPVFGAASVICACPED
jgi:CSLREA domain-containing protein